MSSQGKQRLHAQPALFGSRTKWIAGQFACQDLLRKCEHKEPKETLRFNTGRLEVPSNFKKKTGLLLFVLFVVLLDQCLLR